MRGRRGGGVGHKQLRQDIKQAKKKGERLERFLQEKKEVEEKKGK